MSHRWTPSSVQRAMSVLYRDEHLSGPERRALVARGVCPDCRRPLNGVRVDRRYIRVTCSRQCGYTSIQGTSSGLARVLGLEPRG